MFNKYFLQYEVNYQSIQFQIPNFNVKSMQGEQKIKNIKVVCRFRPLNQRQKALGNTTVQELLDDKTVAIKDVKPERNSNVQPLLFSFDKVFDSNSKQADVYDYAAASVIDSVIEGFNGTILAYGQTSSGKTHTMQGQIGQNITQNSGIIPRMVTQVFSSISKCSQNIQFRIKVSIAQIYMEKIQDLINPSKTKLEIRQDKKLGIFISNLTEVYISSASEVYELIEIAKKSRVIAETKMNACSSRSHLIFILTLNQNNLQDMSAKTGKLYLVDLAGSEKVGKTGATGQLLEQAIKINASLTTLGKVINALSEGSGCIPYRESKLTRILQESLGGNSQTTLIVTCSPHQNNASQTVTTLRFGVSAKKIKNKPKINKELTVAQLQNLLTVKQGEIQKKQAYIGRLKQYITGELKQPIPNFSKGTNNLIQNQQEYDDLVNQLQNQLIIERTLYATRQEELNSLKQKFQKLGNEKQSLEQEVINSKNIIKLLEQSQKEPQLMVKKNKSPKQIKEIKEIKDNSNLSINMDNFIKELESITKDEKVLLFLKQKRSNKVVESAPEEEYAKLLEDYESQKQKCKKSDQKMQKYEKLMQKKLSQLQNNICQLTHAYYDLLIIQQRHKVDNIFLKKKLQQKDISILTLKQRIKDLQDQNRDLEQQKWNDDDDQYQKTTNVSNKKPLSKYSITEEQQNKLNQLCEKRNLNMGANTNTKVVKVVRGGNK